MQKLLQNQCAVVASGPTTALRGEGSRGEGHEPDDLAGRAGIMRRPRMLSHATAPKPRPEGGFAGFPHIPGRVTTITGETPRGVSGFDRTGIR